MEGADESTEPFVPTPTSFRSFLSVLKQEVKSKLMTQEHWSSGYGRILMFQRLWVRIPELSHILDGHFSHLFVVKISMMFV